MKYSAGRSSTSFNNRQMSGDALDKVAVQIQSIEYRQSLLQPLAPMLYSCDVLLNIDTVVAGFRRDSVSWD